MPAIRKSKRSGSKRSTKRAKGKRPAARGPRWSNLPAVDRAYTPGRIDRLCAKSNRLYEAVTKRGGHPKTGGATRGDETNRQVLTNFGRRLESNIARYNAMLKGTRAESVFFGGGRPKAKRAKRKVRIVRKGKRAKARAR